MKTLKENVLIFSGVRGDTRRYRTLHLYEQLRLAGVDCTLSHLTDPRLPDQARIATAAILHRVAYDRYVAKILSILHQRNALIVLDTDDFLYDPWVMSFIDSPDFADPVRFSNYRKEILRHQKTLEQCNAITVSTDYLAKLMHPFRKPTFVHRNAYSVEMLERSNKAFRDRQSNSEKIVIGYASGTRTHDLDFAMVRPTIQRIMSKHQQVDLWLMGPVDPGDGWEGLGERIQSFPFVPWRMLPERLAMLDINLAPLILDNPFNQAKSEIKFMEAALVSVPTVASKTDAFVFAIQSDKTGMLVEDGNDWYQAVEALVVNAEKRKEMGEKAYQDVLLRYSPKQRGEEYVELLASQIVQKGIKNQSTRIHLIKNSLPAAPMQNSYLAPEMESRPTYFDLALYSIKNRGLVTLLGQVWIFFRRLISPIIPFSSQNKR